MKIVVTVNEMKKKPLPRWLKTSILMLSVGVVVSIAVTSRSNDSSNAFAEKFNELRAVRSEIGEDLANVGNLGDENTALEENKNYTGIISNLESAIVKLNNIEINIKTYQTLLVEFQSLVDSSSDQNVKTTGTRFIEASKAGNIITLKEILSTKDLINLSIPYYNDLANGQEGTIDKSKLAALDSSLAADQKSLENLEVEWDAAVKDFAKAAGFTVTFLEK